MGKNNLRLRAAFAVASLGLLALRLVAAEPLVWGSIETITPDGPVRGWWAKVRLDDPRVRLDATAPLPERVAEFPAAETRLLPVNEWAEAQGTTLAVNASFFDPLNDPKRATPTYTPNYRTGDPSDIRGLSTGTHGVVSPARVVGPHGDPALLIYADGRARAAYATDADLQGVVCAVAGIGETDDHKTPGTLLIEAGRNTGRTARVAPLVRHPRTAAGVSADGRTLILLTIDGRQPGHSVGVTLPELADLLLELGAHDAVALDGGGSTSFYLKRPDGSVVTNKPSAGKWRPVANHLGVWVKWPEPKPVAPTASAAEKK